MSDQQPTQADVDAAWAALQPLYRIYAEAETVHYQAAETWTLETRLLRQVPVRGAALLLAETGAAVERTFAALQTAHAAYRTAIIAYDVLRLRVELGPKGETEG